eukprot:3391811-Prymnesium_polylepis.1
MRCIWTEGTTGSTCFIGNCPCHIPTETMDAVYSPQNANDFAVPSFVGESYYCDGGQEPTGRFSNTWNSRPMFSSTTTCNGKLTGGAQARSADWWSMQGLGGAGFFQGYLQQMSPEPLEIRLMTGRDTFYENIGIAQIELEACVCKPEQSRDDCIAMCNGVYIDCKGGQSSCSCTLAG